MDQVNVNTTPPRQPPPPRRPSNWPLYAFIAILIVVILAALAIAAARRGLFGAAQPTATPTAVPTATATAAPARTATPTAIPGAAATATAIPGAAPTATPASGTASATPTPGTAPTATPTASGATPPPAQPPTNPTAMHVTSGSCSVHQIVWTWSGAQRATSYDVVIYDPRTGATVRSTSTHGTSYTLGAGPGTTVALKVRSRNAAGTAPNFYTPGSVGRVPPATPNPTSMTASTTGNKITWSWTAVPHATAYDVVLYHYSGGATKSDITARTTLAHWSTGVTPGVTYYLKVRTVGPCAPSGYFAPPTPVAAGATPTPHA